MPLRNSRNMYIDYLGSEESARGVAKEFGRFSTYMRKINSELERGAV